MISKSSRSWFLFVPILAGATFGDGLLACVGAFVGIAAATYAGFGLQAAMEATPYLFASIGASAVLVFAVPASPWAQPWPVIGGNVISAVVGLVFHRLARHSYPHRAEPALPRTDVGVIRADVDRARAETGETFDISPAYLRHCLAAPKSLPKSGSEAPNDIT